MVVREDRKELIIDNAVGIFAEKGYYKATTAMVAAGAGVTQPYVFHFFRNKEELFNAVVTRAAGRICEIFNRIEAPADRLMDTMGNAFLQIMSTHRDEILLLMQAYTIAEPGIRAVVREKFGMIYDEVVAKFEQARVPNVREAASQFMGTGLLIAQSEVLELPRLLWCNHKAAQPE
ncbi:TetR/AcrR family transcriptional regulator [Paenibacillus humicola]|uniref:TetR/AcrR family transcriptional regulator n=1 Tax=Paenibacillus humicola TaxID=3110540 RepID=UPI00237A2EB0|nr:TetR/AcrR family transcriptional regulator [Paenibacillus humicola]